MWMHLRTHKNDRKCICRHTANMDVPEASACAYECFIGWCYDVAATPLSPPLWTLARVCAANARGRDVCTLTIKRRREYLTRKYGPRFARVAFARWWQRDNAAVIRSQPIVCRCEQRSVDGATTWEPVQPRAWPVMSLMRLIVDVDRTVVPADDRVFVATTMGQIFAQTVPMRAGSSIVVVGCPWRPLPPYLTAYTAAPDATYARCGSTVVIVGTCASVDVGHTAITIASVRNVYAIMQPRKQVDAYEYAMSAYAAFMCARRCRYNRVVKNIECPRTSDVYRMLIAGAQSRENHVSPVVMERVFRIQSHLLGCNSCRNHITAWNRLTDRD